MRDPTTGGGNHLFFSVFLILPWSIHPSLLSAHYYPLWGVSRTSSLKKVFSIQAHFTASFVWWTWRTTSLNQGCNIAQAVSYLRRNFRFGHLRLYSNTQFYSHLPSFLLSFFLPFFFFYSYLNMTSDSWTWVFEGKNKKKARTPAPGFVCLSVWVSEWLFPNHILLTVTFQVTENYIIPVSTSR